MISLRGAVSVLGRFPALAGVDFAVAQREIVLLIGPNGAGKSTLLRLCAGLAALSGGEAEVLGQDLRQDRRNIRRRAGYLGHANALYDDLTVLENVRFWARAAGALAADADAALDRLAVTDRIRGLAAIHLSAGQRRRVALAALLARKPELWLLDEPHAGLDAAARDDLDELVHAAVLEGATVVMASHELERASSLATRCVTIAGGVVSNDEPVAPVAKPAGVPT